jgi:hypothetical protein
MSRTRLVVLLLLWLVVVERKLVQSAFIGEIAYDAYDRARYTVG